MNTLSAWWPLAVGPALFAGLVPVQLRYRAGPIARLGVLIGVAAAFLAADDRFRPWFHGAFYLYALAGLGLCAVGINDRKPSAWWTALGVAGLTGAVALSAPWVAFVGGVAFVIALCLRPVDPTQTPDVVNEPGVAHNRTRRARSLPRKLLREGQLHFLPLYYLARLSDLAREGMANSGSYRFADHIYRLQPSGRGALGRWVDRQFLRLPATQAFHLRYKRAQVAVREALAAAPGGETPLRVLAIPCGLPRDLTELAATLAREDPALLARLEYHGMDIDPELLRRADDFTASAGIPRRCFHRGNALLAADYPPGQFHAIVSTGLGEFLQAAELETFYRNVHAALRPGGTFYTSATRHEPRSEAFLRAFELITQYRTKEQLERILRRLPWSRLTLTQDRHGLQTFVVAVK